jgi:hypothetical protein
VEEITSFLKQGRKRKYAKKNEDDVDRLTVDGSEQLD